MAEKEILGVEDVAEMFNVTVEQVRKLIHTAGLPCRKCGNKWLFSRQGIYSWLASGDCTTEKLRRARMRGDADENTDAE